MGKIDEWWRDTGNFRETRYSGDRREPVVEQKENKIAWEWTSKSLWEIYWCCFVIKQSRSDSSVRPAHTQSISKPACCWSQLPLPPPSSGTLLIYSFVLLYIGLFHLDPCLTKWGLTLSLIEMHLSIGMLIRRLVCKDAIRPGGWNM